MKLVDYLKRTLCVCCLIVLSQPLYAARMTLDLEEPDYKSLETVVRLKRVDGAAYGACSDYLGLGVMISTRDKVTKKTAWAGTVEFSPLDREPAKLKKKESKVDFKHLVHPKYRSADRAYGERMDPKGENITEDRVPNRIFCNELITKSEDGKRTSKEKGWVHSSYFEWQLAAPLTIADTISRIGGMKIGRRYPEYLLYGYSHDGGCLNCVTFSLAFLRTLGVRIDRVERFDRYVNNYLEKTNRGRVGDVITVGATVTTGVVGGAAGAEVGALLGSAGGPVGMALGAAAGVGVGLLIGFFSKCDIIRSKSTLKILYDNRERLGLGIVFTGQSRIGKATIFENKSLLDILNSEKGWFSSRIGRLDEERVRRYEFNY